MAERTKQFYTIEDPMLEVTASSTFDVVRFWHNHHEFELKRHDALILAKWLNEDAWKP